MMHSPPSKPCGWCGYHGGAHDPACHAVLLAAREKLQAACDHSKHHVTRLTSWPPGPRCCANCGAVLSSEPPMKLTREQELEAARNMESDCTIGTSGNGAKYTREIAERLRGHGPPLVSKTEELVALRTRIAELEAERDRMLPIYRAHLAEEQRRAEARDRELARVAALTEHELHCEQRHPDFEYATTENMRKSGDSPKPDGEGWEENDIIRGPGVTSERWCNWTRGEYTEINYWRRRRTPKT